MCTPSNLARLLAIATALSWLPLRAEEKPPQKKPEDIAAAARPAVVVIRAQGRTGDVRGEGSGFVVRSTGVMATNFHVIGEGRQFSVELADKTRLKPTAILAVDRAKDLALFQVDGKDLPALELGDSSAVQSGQTAVAVGNSLGLGLSAVSGAIAEVREVHDRKLIQVAMSVEPGSSGSPLLDLNGRVVGILAIKAGVSTGFAVPINDLKPMLDSPRAIPMERWLKIGALDAMAWKPLFGGEWRQQAGRIVASGLGDGFGGRTLCLSGESPPADDFDLVVEVKLEDESGAAGLVFHSDGNDKHYGFYPTAGSLRLTCFEGPDVFTWRILSTVPSPSYRPGEWNAIRVSCRGAKILCSVNGETAIEAEDDALKGGQVGLVKFRAPGAEFRHFRVAPQLALERPSPEAMEKADKLASGIAAGSLKDEDAFAQAAALEGDGLQALTNRAKELEKGAARLREIAEEARRRAVIQRLAVVLGAKEEDANLLEAALLIAKIDNPDIDIPSYLDLVDRMAREAAERLRSAKTPAEKLSTLLEHFFEDLSFRGSELEYYSRSNSYVNEVLDDREGIPITLSVLFLELARRVGVPAAGIGIPAHFIVECRPEGGDPRLIDVFGGGKRITRDEAAGLSGRSLEDADFKPTTKRQIVLRMLNNLFAVAQREGDAEGMARYVDAMVPLEQETDAEGSLRWMRAALRLQLGRPLRAREDAAWLLEHGAPGVPRERIEELSRMLEGRQ